MTAARRTFLIGVLAAPLCVGAVTKAPRKVGILFPGPSGIFTEGIPHLQAYMQREGFGPGEVTFVPRAADDHYERLPGLARQLVEARVDVIITEGSPATHAAVAATTTIPIVTAVGDPVRSGFAKSIAKPGGNVTGLSGGLFETARGQIDLLRGFLPRLRRVFVFQRPDMSPETIDVPIDAARDLGLAPERVMVRSAADIDDAFEAMQRPDARAAGVVPNTLAVMDNAAMAQRAARRGIALSSQFPDWVDAGGLLSFALLHRDENAQKLAVVVRILRGAKAAEHPFLMPDTYELAVNRATARALGLTIPDDVRLRATRIVG